MGHGHTAKAMVSVEAASASNPASMPHNKPLFWTLCDNFGHVLLFGKRAFDIWLRGMKDEGQVDVPT